LELDETFNYLGTEEGDGIDNRQVKDKLVEEWQILKTFKLEERSQLSSP